MPNRQWHPVFVAALKEALKDAPPGQIEIEAEVALSSKPLDVDVVVIKKTGEIKLAHPIARFFRGYNLFEYKSPGDYLEANDFDKGMALAFLYKALKHPELATLDDFTFTFVSSAYPRAMLGTLKKRGLEIKKDTAGIYAVMGWIFPLQVVVLNEPLDPEVDYMFAVFKTGPRKQRAKAWAVLIKKYLADPADRNLQQLAEFALRNELVQFEDVEEVLEMARQMSTEERERMYQLFTTHPVSRAWSEKIRAESLAIGKIEGKIEAKQEVICKFLARRFGLDSAEIQEKVRRLTDLPVLDDVLAELFAASSIEEAKKIITAAGSGRSQNHAF